MKKLIALALSALLLFALLTGCAQKPAEPAAAEPAQPAAEEEREALPVRLLDTSHHVRVLRREEIPCRADVPERDAERKPVSDEDPA